MSVEEGLSLTSFISTSRQALIILTESNILSKKTPTPSTLNSNFSVLVLSNLNGNYVYKKYSNAQVN